MGVVPQRSLSGTSECHYQGRGVRGGALAARRQEGRGCVKRAGPLTVRVGVESISLHAVTTHYRHDSFVRRLRWHNLAKDITVLNDETNILTLPGKALYNHLKETILWMNQISQTWEMSTSVLLYYLWDTIILFIYILCVFVIYIFKICNIYIHLFLLILVNQEQLDLVTFWQLAEIESYYIILILFYFQYFLV